MSAGVSCIYEKRQDGVWRFIVYCLLFIGLVLSCLLRLECIVHSLLIVIKLDVFLDIVDFPGCTMSGPGVALHTFC
jgi:hypothetical protein